MHIHTIHDFQTVATKWVKSHCTPSLSKIKKVVMEILFIGVVLTMEVIFPVGNFILWLTGQVVTWVITDRNIKRIKMQKKEGFDDDLAQRALKSLKKSSSLQQRLNKQIIVTLIASLLIQTVSPIFGVIGLCFCCWHYYKTHNRMCAIQKEIDIQRNNSLCLNEKSELEKLYGNNMKHYAAQERDLRKYKFRYLTKQRGWISSAWVKLLNANKFTIDQGISFDWEIMSVLCNLAVLEELKEPLILKERTCPPSLNQRLEQLKSTKKLWGQLTANEKSFFCDKVLQEKEQLGPKFQPLINNVRSLGWKMYQLPIFQKSIFEGSEKYCLKSFKLNALFGLEKRRIINYKNHLIFNS